VSESEMRFDPRPFSLHQTPNTASYLEVSEREARGGRAIGERERDAVGLPESRP